MIFPPIKVADRFELKIVKRRKSTYFLDVFPLNLTITSNIRDHMNILFKNLCYYNDYLKIYIKFELMFEPSIIEKF